MLMCIIHTYTHIGKLIKILRPDGNYIERIPESVIKLITFGVIPLTYRNMGILTQKEFLLTNILFPYHKSHTLSICKNNKLQNKQIK